MADTAWPEVIGGLLGGGTIGTVVTRWLRARTADRRIEARLIELENEREDRVREAALRLMSQATDDAREAREETGRHLTSFADVAHELGRLGAENVELRARVERLEEENRQLRAQVRDLLPEAIKGFALTDEATTPPRPTLVRPIRREE
jgi:chromosome segregation ATPase